jgi:hypothetical protein
MNIPDPFARTIRLRVTLTDAYCTLPNGEPLPAIAPGTSAEIIIQATALIDPSEREKFTREDRLLLLLKQTELWARVKPDTVEEHLAAHRVLKTGLGGKDGLFVVLLLVDDLYLIKRTGKSAMLDECRCHIPALGIDVASVNEAYTRISAAFEPWRRSHSGNVFREVYYGGGMHLSPLDRLRSPMEIEMITLNQKRYAL